MLAVLAHLRRSIGLARLALVAILALTIVNGPAVGRGCGLTGQAPAAQAATADELAPDLAGLLADSEFAADFGAGEGCPDNPSFDLSLTLDDHADHVGYELAEIDAAVSRTRADGHEGDIRRRPTPLLRPPIA